MTVSTQINRLWTATSLLMLSSIFFSGVADAAEDLFCKQFARDIAFTYPYDTKSLSTSCRNDPRWTVGKPPADPRLAINKDKNYQWCLTASKAEVNKKRFSHNRDVNKCKDTYKVINLISGRVISRKTSSSDVDKMEVASQGLIHALLSSTTHNPYSRLFPLVNKAVRNNKLKSCRLTSLSVEVDNNKATSEWIIANNEDCFKSYSGISHFWLLQQKGTTYRILFEGEDRVIKLNDKRYNQYRNISASSTLGTEPGFLCGELEAKWHYVKGRYIPYKVTPWVFEECVGYNLPDRLQGANTFSLQEGEWEKEMLLEEKKRDRLFAPEKRKLANYIPQWMSDIKKLTTVNSKHRVALSAPLPVSSSSRQPSPVSIKQSVIKTKKDKATEELLGVDIEDLQDLLALPD